MGALSLEIRVALAVGLKAVGNTTVFTSSDGADLFRVMYILVEAADVSGVTAAPRWSLGFTSTAFNDIIDQNISGLTATGQLEFGPLGAGFPPKVIPASTPLVFRVAVAATATTFTGNVFVVGHYE